MAEPVVGVQSLFPPELVRCEATGGDDGDRLREVLAARRPILMQTLPTVNDWHYLSACCNQ
jgi:hypothetical protein